MRVAIATLGCKVNQYDSAVMQNRFAAHNWSLVPFDGEADAYVVNSCTVTDRADSDARRLARKARRLNPAARVIMTGCYAQVSPAMIEKLGYVDYVVGLGRLDDLLEAVAGELERKVSVSDLRKSSQVETLGIDSFAGRSRAFVKVQEGCNLFCTFCVVPVARGPSRSVPPRLVLEEITRLQARGYGEVVLTGVHLGGYGHDLDPAMDLAGLLECIAENQPQLRVRISSIDPPELTPRLIDIVRSSPVFCRHFHVPLQSLSDGVLSRMGRKYSVEQAAAALERLRSAMPGVCLGTDIISGFPGETESEFNEGLAAIEELNLSYLHVFPYSIRSSTSAAKRWPALEEGLVHRRARELRALDRRLRRSYQDGFIGRSVDVLLEGERDDEPGRLRGYSGNYLPLSCVAGPEMAGRLTRVKIAGRYGKRLEGVLA